MKVNNLRPTRPEDSLRRLLDRVDQDHTVPFGQKAATAGEGINYQTSNGASYRWDGDAVADYDQRIKDGQTAIAQAKADLNTTEQNLDAAKDRISTVETDTTPEAIGTTASDQINARRLLVGRDAILTGTVDVAQLNVTQELSASVVDAMSVDAKKLVVTDDAILNRATVVESLVTPELVADRINVNNLGAQLVTSGALQTDSASNRGMKITSSGIQGYDDTGTKTMQIDGRNNLIVGDLATGADKQTRATITTRGSLSAVDLYSRIDGNTTAPHGAVWFDSPDADVKASALHISATVQQSLQPEDPQIALSPLYKALMFQSKVSGGGTAMRAGGFETANIANGSYRSITVTFPTPMTTGNVGVSVCPVSENGNEYAIGYKNVSKDGFTVLLVNKAPRDTGYNWVKWFAWCS